MWQQHAADQRVGVRHQSVDGEVRDRIRKSATGEESMSAEDAKPVKLTEPPSGYADWLAELKARIHTAQRRATLAVNRELVRLYWQIGQNILLACEHHFPATIADLYNPEKIPADLRAVHERNDEVLERIYIGQRFKTAPSGWKNCSISIPG
jgi:hypothetical protein